MSGLSWKRRRSSKMTGLVKRAGFLNVEKRLFTRNKTDGVHITCKCPDGKKDVSFIQFEGMDSDTWQVHVGAYSYDSHTEVRAVEIALGACA